MMVQAAAAPAQQARCFFFKRTARGSIDGNAPGDTNRI